VSSLRDISEKISSLVEEVRDSVVTIFVEKPELSMFFTIQRLRSVGSGFGVSNKYVITNAHVVGEAINVMVIYADGSRGEGEVLARDVSRDLALIRVYESVKPVKLGDSDNVKVGELVLAVGSPLGLPGPSVSLGVVSALGRTIVGENVFFEDLIQTDAAINPGNSGGPLINMVGEAIGVTTAMIPYAQGIGFAIPINVVKRFIYMLEKYGRPLRAWIGVYVAQLTRDMSRLLNIPVDEGVVVARVVPGTPAYYAGVREGDVIVKANDRVVKKIRDLRESIEDSIDKGYVVLEIIRSGVKHRAELPIMIEEL